MNAYSDLKPAWHLDKIADLRATGHCVPAQIQLVVSDLCNEACSFCAYRMEGYSSNQHFGEVRPDGTVNNNPNRMVPYEKCIEILDDAAALGVKAVQFTGGGEPTVHPRFLDIAAYALSKNLKCSLVTNGTLFRDGWRDVLPRFEWVRVSLDAGTSATYAAIRKVKPDMFHRALINLSDLALASSVCYVGASFIVTRENWFELRSAAVAAKENDARSIRYAAIFSPEMASYYDGHRAQIEAEIASIKSELEDAYFEVIDLFTQRMGDLSQGAPDYKTCGYQHFNVYIGGDLNVYRCCNTAYNDLGRVGSLKGQRFADFWKSEQKQDAYSKFDARACEHCAFNGKNRTINYMVQANPQHVEFV